MCALPVSQLSEPGVEEWGRIGVEQGLRGGRIISGHAAGVSSSYFSLVSDFEEKNAMLPSDGTA